MNPETEIVGSSYDKAKHVHTYTIERGGKRWTFEVPDVEFAQFGPVIGAQAATNKARRRAYLAGKANAAMQGTPDA